MLRQAQQPGKRKEKTGREKRENITMSLNYTFNSNPTLGRAMREK